MNGLRGWVGMLLVAGSVTACDSTPPAATGRVEPPTAARELPVGYGPDGSFRAPPPSGEGRSVATRWPILLSHPFSVTAEQSFRGESLQSDGQFDVYGVKRMLEAGGAVVYQPNKIAYGSHQNRGQLLYRKCAGATLSALLCEGADPEVVDGVHAATLDYCAQPALRARSGFADEDGCRRGLQFNVICHSQGCPDSRYMLAAVRNEFSGELMHRHIASWTSMAGANKGTAQADFYLDLFAAGCLTPDCRSPAIDAAFAALSLQQNQALILNGSESAVALSMHYMLLSTDMSCDPARRDDCAPSFNALYPLPDDPVHPVLYQTFTSYIRDIDHPCYGANRDNWTIVVNREGDNDGNISIDSQKFTTYGLREAGPATPVIARWVDGQTLDAARPHPGLNHMAYATTRVPGMHDGTLSCDGEDNRHYRFSRLGLYRDIVAELAGWGY
ncbi:MAG TPA: hypothetical protein VGE57_07745 [Solimonas sp.]